jgi:hypothetical protein
VHRSPDGTRLLLGPWVALIASLLSLLGSLLAPAKVQIQPFPGLFPGSAAAGYGLPFMELAGPLAGAFLAGAAAGLLLARRHLHPLLPPPLASATLLWGMLWGGGWSERGLLASLVVGILATGYALPYLITKSRGWPGLVSFLLPHGLALFLSLALIGWFGTLPMLVLGTGLIHLLLAFWDGIDRWRGAASALLFLAQVVLLIYGMVLFPLLPHP